MSRADTRRRPSTLSMNTRNLDRIRGLMYPCRSIRRHHHSNHDVHQSRRCSGGAHLVFNQQAASLPLGALVHDGPATPEQISLFLPVTRRCPQTGDGHSPIQDVGYFVMDSRASSASHPAVVLLSSVPDAFAWPIIDLLPGTAYDVEVTVTSGSTIDIKVDSLP